MATFEKIVIVTRKTRLTELIERFNTIGQAKFYIEHSGGDFSEYTLEDEAYKRSLNKLTHSLNLDLKLQQIDRSILPTFLFCEKDIIITLGQDGLVANTAKYAGNQPIIGVNPDPERINGVLLPFSPSLAKGAIENILENKASFREVTMAEVQLSDGQHLLAFNDLFIGCSSHISARYKIKWNGQSEPQSSSGIIVSTGAGSTGWLSSIFNMSSGVSEFLGAKQTDGFVLPWEDPRLVFIVREPFKSRSSSANIVMGMLEQDNSLELESLMPSAGVIFSDGIENDHLSFNSGAIARIHTAKQRARLVVG